MIRHLFVWHRGTIRFSPRNTWFLTGERWFPHEEKHHPLQAFLGLFPMHHQINNRNDKTVQKSRRKNPPKITLPSDFEFRYRASRRRVPMESVPVQKTMPSSKSDSDGRENLGLHYRTHSNLLPFAMIVVLMSNIPLRVAIPNKEMKPMIAGILTSPVVITKANTPPISASGSFSKDDARLFHAAELIIQ